MSSLRKKVRHTVYPSSPMLPIIRLPPQDCAVLTARFLALLPRGASWFSEKQSIPFPHYCLLPKELATVLNRKVGLTTLGFCNSNRPTFILSFKWDFKKCSLWFWLGSLPEAGRPGRMDKEAGKALTGGPQRRVGCLVSRWAWVWVELVRDPEGEGQGAHKIWGLVKLYFSKVIQGCLQRSHSESLPRGKTNVQSGFQGQRQKKLTVQN